MLYVTSLHRGSGRFMQFYDREFYKGPLIWIAIQTRVSSENRQSDILQKAQPGGISQIFGAGVGAEQLTSPLCGRRSPLTVHRSKQWIAYSPQPQPQPRVRPPVSSSPKSFHFSTRPIHARLQVSARKGSVGQNKLASFVMEGAQGGSSNLAKHKKRKSPVQRWRPISTEAVPQKDDANEISNSGSGQVVEECITSSENLASDGATNAVIEVTTNDASLSKNNISLESSSTKVVIEDNEEVSGFNKDLDESNVYETYSFSIEVDVPLMRFVKGKGGSMQKKIEEDTGVKIIFPSSREETSVVLEGTSSESIRKASQMIANVLEEAVQSRMLDYSHFISLPLAIHPDLVHKLNYFQSSILGASASNEESDQDKRRSEGSIDEMDHDHKQADGSSVSINLQVQEESVQVKMDSKGSRSDFGIDKTIFIKPKTFHLTVVMLKLWNKDRIAKASEVLQSISSQVNEALENRPISIQLRGLTCMKGSPAKARVVYAPVLEVGGEGRLARACKVIIDAFVKSGLVLERDARQELKLHATIMNVRHRKSKQRNRWNDSFDARDIFRKYGKEEWGEYHIPEVHLSQRFKFDESGYYHCCSSIPLPAEMRAK